MRAHVRFFYFIFKINIIVLEGHCPYGAQYMRSGNYVSTGVAEYHTVRHRFGPRSALP